MCVRDRASIQPQGGGQVDGAVDYLGGALGHRIVVETHLSVFVAEQVRMLGDQGHSHDMSCVTEHLDQGKLGRVDHVGEGEKGVATAHGGTGPWAHRFLLAARLAVDAGIWNTSK